MKTVLLCVAAIALSGCAGLIAPFINNPYAGTYTGTFVASDGRAGPASVSLTNIGNVFGTLTDTKTGDSGSLTGSVNTHLVFTGTVSFPGSSHSVGGTFVSSKGEVTGTLTGSGGYTFTLDVDSKT